MTPEQKSLVRESFAKVAPIAPAVAEMFYNRLFELDPSLRSLFKIDMKEQGRKLIAMIVTAVSNLDRLDEIIPAVQIWGAATPDTAFWTRITTLSPTPCCGLWSSGWARTSRRRRKRPGPRAMSCWRAK